MANSYSFFLTLHLLFLSALIITISSSTVGASNDVHALNWIPSGRVKTCQGTIAECMENDDEFEMDTVINRRILQTTSSGNTYISYDALQRNNIPCSQRGASYYNCQPGAQANPYTRGCSAITRCRS